jgi:hypothetical protein
VDRSKIYTKIYDLYVFTLVVFKSIYENGNANVTARLLSVSASKIARSLKALRSTFDDELFIRRHQGLKPTPLSDILILPIRQFVDLAWHIEHVSKSDPLNKAIEPLRIAVSPGLICFVARSLHCLPSVKFELLSWNENSPEHLHNGDIDLGLCLGKQQTQNLDTEVIGTIKNLCLVGNDKHPIWNMSDQIILENLCEYPFVYQEIKGFNDKVDPFEVFCQKEGIKLTSTHKVVGLEILYAHFLTMNSLAIESASECEMFNSLPGIRSERLAIEQATRLQDSIVSPNFYIIEREDKYRKYSPSVRSELCKIISQSMDL